MIRVEEEEESAQYKQLKSLSSAGISVPLLFGCQEEEVSKPTFGLSDSPPPPPPPDSALRWQEGRKRKRRRRRREGALDYVGQAIEGGGGERRRGERGVNRCMGIWLRLLAEAAAAAAASAMVDDDDDDDACCAAAAAVALKAKVVAVIFFFVFPLWRDVDLPLVYCEHHM